MNKTLVIGIVVLAVLLAFFGGMLTAMTIDSRGHALVGPFTDTAGHPYAWAIEEIRLAGLTAGCNTDPAMYCPDRPLTRGEAAVLLARLLDQ